METDVQKRMAQLRQAVVDAEVQWEAAEGQGVALSRYAPLQDALWMVYDCALVAVESYKAATMEADDGDS